MKSGKRTIILIIGLVFIGLTFLGIIIKKNIKSKKLIDNRVSDKIVDLIISNSFEELDKKTIEDIKRYSEEVAINSNINEEIINTNFILGYLKLKDNDVDESINRFNEALNLIDNDSKPTIKAAISFYLSTAYLYDNYYEKSEELFEDAINICERESLENMLVDFYRERAMRIIDMPGGLQRALILIDKSLELSKKNNYNLAKVYSSAGCAYAIANELIQSIQYQLDAIDICKKDGLTNLEIRNYIEVGVNYIDLQCYEEAIKYLSATLDYTVDDKNEDAFLKSYALVNLCGAYLKVGKVNEAQNWITELKNILDILDENMRDDTTTFVYALEAQIALKNKYFKEARELIELAKYRHKENIGPFLYIDFDILLEEICGDIYYGIGQYDKALECHKEAQRIANEKGTTYYEASHLKLLYLDYLALEDYKNAIKYMDEYIKLQSDLKDKFDEQYLKYLHKQFETENNHQVISNLKYSKKIMQTIIVVSLVVIIIITTMAAYIYKKNREINKLNMLFKNLSVTDSLTGIANRRALDEYLSGNWSLYRKSKMPISFVMIDIDYFKNYNDNYGHPKGDKVLEKVSNEIKNSCRNSDFVARYGGEEFIIIMLNTDKQEAINVVSRIKENVYNLNIKHDFSEVEDRVTISVGISTAYIGSNKDYDDYIKKADKALYEAKKEGRNTFLHLS